MEVEESTRIGASLEGLGTGVISVVGMTLGALLMPTMIKEPEFNWTRQFDGSLDIPISDDISSGDVNRNGILQESEWLIFGPVIRANVQYVKP